MENRKVLKSGEFLVDEVTWKDVFIPEEFSEEQLMIAKTCKDFLQTEIYPVMAQLGAYSCLVNAFSRCT